MLKRKFLFGAIAILIAGYLFIGLGYAIYNFYAGPPMNFFSGFEYENFEGWDPLLSQQLCCDHSAQIVQEPVRRGQFAARFKVLPEDPFVKGSKRAEFRTRAAHRGEHYWYLFSMYLPSPWVVSDHPVILAQWHGVPDMVFAEAGRVPPLTLKAVGDQLIIESVSSGAWVNKWRFSTEVDDTRKTLLTDKLVTDQWTEWAFHVVWSPDGDGLLEIWRDGEQVIRLEGPNTYRDFVAPYFKFGVYAYTWGKSDNAAAARERVAVFDDIFILKGNIPFEALPTAFPAGTADQ